MKEKKYAQILSSVIAFKTTLQFNNEQLAGFASRCVAYCAETSRALSQPSLNLAELEKIKLNLKKDFEKPLLDYQKQVDKISKEITEKIIPCLNQQGQATTLNLESIRQPLEEIKPLVASIKKQLEPCFAELGVCQDKITRVEQRLQKLELPNIIEKLIKQIESLALEHGREALQPLEEAIARLKPPTPTPSP